MQRKPSLYAVLLLVGLLLFQGLAPDLLAQAPPPPTPQQLDQLLAPIALYPDSLLAQITTASTNPQEILDVNNWLGQNQNLTLSQLTAAAQQQGFDPAFIALVGFPQVLGMMAENIDDYAAIGAAVTANQNEVSASIQRLRAQAYAAGSLRSTPQQEVEVQQNAGQPIYIIQPVNPQVVYVPQYNPTVVYAGSGLNAGLITFGIGIGITALLVSQPWGWGGWGWNWGARRITTTVARGAVGEAATVRQMCGTGRARCRITTDRDMGATGAIGHQTTARPPLFVIPLITGREAGLAITGRSISRVIVLPGDSQRSNR